MVLSLHVAANAQVVDPFALRGDPKLQHRLTLVGTKLTFASMVERLEKETNLKFTIDATLSEHNPVFPHVNFRDVPAWTVLEMLARKELEHGQWVKSMDGYQLKGKRTTAPAGAKAVPKTKPPAKGPFPLRADPRLQAIVEINEKNPPFAKLLEQLKNTTHVSLLVDSNLWSHDPRYGMCQWGKVPAWTVMEFIAATQMQDGRWEPEGDGYVLKGIAKTPRNTVWARPTFWLSSSLIVFSVGLLVLWKIRSRRALQAAGKPKSKGE